MASLATKLLELDDTQLEEFIESWAAQKSKGFDSVIRMGAANDKGRDVVGFVTAAKHEGEWHLFQCKRKTRGRALGISEALTELGKIFYHHVDGAYTTLPAKYVFVAPRGVAGPLSDLILNPTKLKEALINTWAENCAENITKKQRIELSDEIRAAMAAFDFGRVSYMNASSLVRDSSAGPALTKFLDAPPADAPKGIAPEAVQGEELYVDQLRDVYEQVSGQTFADANAVLADPTYGRHLRDQRARFFDALAFERFHCENTYEEAIVSFKDDLYHAVVDVYGRPTANRLQRVGDVMAHASVVGVALIGKFVRVPVRQGYCHHFANEESLPWNT